MSCVRAPGHLLIEVVPWAAGPSDGPPISNASAFKLPALGSAPVFNASITSWLAAAGVTYAAEAVVRLTAAAAPAASGGSSAAATPAAAAQRTFPRLSSKAAADLVMTASAQARARSGAHPHSKHPQLLF